MLPSAGNMYAPHTVLSFMQDAYAPHIVRIVCSFMKDKSGPLLTCVCARKAKSSWSVFIREFEPFRFNDKTRRLKLDEKIVKSYTQM